MFFLVFNVLRHGFKFYDWQMFSAFVVSDVEFEHFSRLIFQWSLWRCTFRFNWPAFAGLESWNDVGWNARVAGFVGSSTIQECMRTMLIVIFDNPSDFHPKVFEP